MSKLLERITGIYSTVKEDEPRRPISPTSVDEALNVLGSYHVQNAQGLFYYLSAISLLNAAMKFKQYKTDEYRRKRLTYPYVKGKARVIVENVIAKRTFNHVEYYYNDTEKCLYVKVLDVVFSFHQVEETSFIKNIAVKQPCIEWPGIRLQWIAEDVFSLAKETISK